MDFDRGQWALPAFDLDQTTLRRTSLPKARRADVVGQDIRITMNAQVAMLSGFDRIKPRARRQDRDARQEIAAHSQSGQARSPAIVDPHDIAFVQIARSRIVYVHQYGFAALDLVRDARARLIDLAMKANGRLRRKQVKRIAGRLG